MLKLSPLFLFLAFSLSAKDIAVPDAKSLKSALAEAAPGDTLVLSEGEWKDAHLIVKADGAPGKPITLRAAVLGKTILTGDSWLSLSGHHLVIEGLWFRNPSQTSGEVIEFRTNSKDLAFDCVVRNCAVTSSEPVDLGKKTSRYCSLYGTGNTLEHCHMEGKTTAGTTVVVWLTPGGLGQHKITGNYFGPRPVLKKNGGETIRLGDSETHDQNAKCEVSGNLFYHCNGEGEIISVKSCENRLANNTFIECEGALTLRHAHRCLVEKNLFIGNHKKLTGGIRIVGEDHRILGNWIENCDGDGYRSAITFMNGVPNTKDFEYQQVKRALLKDNSVLDCKVTMLIGMQHSSSCTLPPLDCVIKDNTFSSPKEQLFSVTSEPSGWKWSNNVLNGKSIGIAGIDSREPKQNLNSRPTPLKRTDVGPSWVIPDA